MVIDWPSYKFIKLSWSLVFMCNDYARLLQFSIIDEQKNDDDTIIANKNIELPRFSRLIAHP